MTHRPQAGNDPKRGGAALADNERESDLLSLPGIGPVTAQRLGRLGIFTLEELAELEPRRLSLLTAASEAPQVGDEDLAWQGMIRQANGRYLPGRRHLWQLRVEIDAVVVRVALFNQPYLKETLQVGRSAFFTGTVVLEGGRLELKAARLVAAEEVGRPLPIYPLTEGLSQRLVRSLVQKAADRPWPEDLPTSLLEAEGLLSRQSMLKTLVHPPDVASFHEALRSLWLRRWLRRSRPAAVAGRATALHDRGGVGRLLALLPFTLTAGQLQAAEEILQDLQSDRPMQRLLVGDVGSGKTAVAAVAIARCLDQPLPALLMVPTEVLARQHFETLQPWLAALNAQVRLVTGGGSSERRTLRQMAAQEPRLVLIGTQALLDDKLVLPEVGLVVCDEEHRFGVRQRLRLMAKGTAPHTLVMSATPIPRTLALVKYQDLDCTWLQGRPPGTGRVQTVLCGADDRRTVYDALDKAISRGEQALVVAPSVSAHRGQAPSATALRRTLAKRYPRWRLELVHGGLPTTQKQQLWTAARQGALDVLVATSVLEVGVDLPGASQMVIEGAEHFGLAQLHQLRGRVGRGGKPAVCYLLCCSEDPSSLARLQAVRDERDGFNLAEADLRQRGPGELWGDRQHGFEDLSWQEIDEAGALLTRARRWLAAEETRG